MFGDAGWSLLAADSSDDTQTSLGGEILDIWQAPGQAAVGRVGDLDAVRPNSPKVFPFLWGITPITALGTGAIASVLSVRCVRRRLIQWWHQLVLQRRFVR